MARQQKTNDFGSAAAQRGGLLHFEHVTSRSLELDRSTVNVNGGAIALGHPIGATGVRMIYTLAKEMQKRNVQYGIATLCVGGGQGAAVVLERA